jgi:hypothetical protein
MMLHALLLCVENESVNHLFFGCVVARKAWEEISLAEGFDIDRDIESIARCWLCNKKFGIVNMSASTVRWSIWKVRNFGLFSGCCLVRDEDVVAKIDADTEMLVPRVQWLASDKAIAALERVMTKPEAIEVGTLVFYIGRQPFLPHMFFLLPPFSLPPLPPISFYLTSPIPNTNQHHVLVPGSHGVCMPSPLRLISLHCRDLYQDIHVPGFMHCWSLFYTCSCGVLYMCMSNVMMLLYVMSYILRVYVHIRNYIWLGIAFSIFAYDTLWLLVKGGERIFER